MKLNNNKIQPFGLVLLFLLICQYRIDAQNMNTNYIKIDTIGNLDKIITRVGRNELNNHYYSDGKIKNQFSFLYIEDSLIGYHGNAIEFYKSGQVKYIETYFEGFIIGKAIEYFKSGKLKSESFYLPDSSSHIAVIEIDGKIQSPNNSSSLATSGGFQSKLKYLPHGIWKEYYENGQVKSIKSYDHGLEIGVWQWFYPDGKKKMYGEFIEDKITIPTKMNIVVSCDDCEYVMSNIHYTFLRKKKGEWNCWDKNGMPIKCDVLYR